MDELDRYGGPATLRVGDREFGVHATLSGYFEPIDGRYHWRGRLARNDELAAAARGRAANAVLSTGHGSAQCVVSDPDPWGRYRVSGISRPPFPTALTGQPRP
jgi:hypothetical protein